MCVGEKTAHMYLKVSLISAVLVGKVERVLARVSGRGDGETQTMFHYVAIRNSPLLQHLATNECLFFVDLLAIHNRVIQLLNFLDWNLSVFLNFFFKLCLSTWDS